LKFDDTGSLPISPTVQLGTTGEAYPIDAALASQPHVYQPWGIAVDRADNDALYVAENWGYSLAKFYEFGPNAGKLAWRVPADPGNYGADLHHFGSFSGSNQGSLAVDDNHHIYVPDSGNNRVMVYLPDGTLFGQIGNGKGSGPYQFSCPNGVGVTLYNIFVADTCNQRIQVFDYNLNYVGTIGQTGMAGTDSGHFNHPVSVAGDLTLGYVFVVDQGNQRVQRCKWDPTKHTSTCTPFAGVTGVSGGRDFHYLNQPASVGVDTVTSRVFISEEDTSRIQVFNESDGTYLTTLSGEWGDEGSRVRDPAGISIGMNSEVYVADRENARILRFSPVIAGWNQLNINGFGSPFNKDVSGLA
jgi:hypothetical protein